MLYFYNEVITLGLAFVISFLFIMCFYLLIPYITPNQLSENKQLKSGFSPADKLFCIITPIFFLICCIIAYSFDGYATDMSCWSAWGERMFTLGAGSFYSPDYFCDYPPGYIYILGLISGLSKTFGISASGSAFLYKLPALIADVAIFSALYKLGKRFLSDVTALSAAALFLVSPVFRLDSAVWGQVESVLIVLLLYSAIKLYDKKYTSSVLLYVLAVLVKPQALIAAPVYLFALIETRDAKQIVISAVSGLALFIALIMPFSPAWNASSDFFAFINALNPVWVIEKYTGTIASYPYFSVNAFNLYGLLGLNWVSFDSAAGKAFLSFINAAVITMACAGSAYIFYKVKNRGSKIALSCYFLFGFLFTFAFKMHERYIILPTAFLLLDFFFSKNKKMPLLFVLFSTIGYLNLFYILQLAQTTGAMPEYYITAIISAAEVIVFLSSLWIIYKDYLSEANTLINKKNIQKKQPAAYSESHTLVRLDYILLAVIVLVYSVIAFTNLGDTKAPQSYYKPESVNDSFVIELETPETITAIDYYCGIGDVDSNPGLKLEYSDNGTDWSESSQTVCRLNAMFRWETDEITPFTAKYLRLTPQSEDYMLFEAGFRLSNGSLAVIKSVNGNGVSDYCAAFDEQFLIPDASSYKNSTYFDEIYHPRTAYEHLHLMEYYETTHPPLGKLIMSIGIAVFGMTPFGWRCMGVLFGILMLPMLYILLKRLFGRTRYCVIGTLLFAFDFMHYSLTRLGTIDSYPVFFTICMYMFMYDFGKRALSLAGGNDESFKDMLKSLFLSGLSMGLGCASKWTAVYASVGLAIEFIVIMYFVYKKTKDSKSADFKGFALKICAWCILFFVIIPGGIYILSYLPIAMTGKYGNIFQAMWNNQQYMLKYHSGLQGTHPYSSSWYTWPFVYKPMWAYQAPDAALANGQIGCISIFQNPLLSWLGTAAFFYSLYIGFKKKDKRVLFLLIGLLAQYLPWVFVSRYTLQYHFFGTMPFLVCFAVYAAQELESKNPRFRLVTNLTVAACIIMFVMFYPLLTGIPISKAWVQTILVWFKTWVFFI